MRSDTVRNTPVPTRRAACCAMMLPLLLKT